MKIIAFFSRNRHIIIDNRILSTIFISKYVNLFFFTTIKKHITITIRTKNRLYQRAVLQQKYITIQYRYLLAIVLSVLLRYTDSDCPIGIFKLFLISKEERHRVHLFTITTVCPVQSRIIIEICNNPDKHNNIFNFIKEQQEIIYYLDIKFDIPMTSQRLQILYHNKIDI